MKADAVTRLASATSWAKANLLVRSMATNRWSLTALRRREIADRVGLELRLGGFVAVNVRQARDAVTLQAAVQPRPRQVRDRRLQGIEAIVQRQERMLAEGDDDGLVLDAQQVHFGCFVPVGKSETEVRFRHLATVFWLIP
jgi:hypothetical protein